METICLRIRKKLKECGGLDEIYDAMDSNDSSDLLKAASKALQKTDCIVDVKCHKSKTMSSHYRIKGNQFYELGLYKPALISYNRALALASNGSHEQMLAYGNRSAVMFAIRFFTACLNDVNSCLSMGCPKLLAKKLSKRKKATYQLILEEFQHDSLVFANLFIPPHFHHFKFECRRNADVPCVSADVTFLNQSGTKQVVAAKDIKAGCVVAIEKAFVSGTIDIMVTCYYCLRLTPQLYPCNGCTHALFCSDECRDQCMEEYHRVECQILDHIEVNLDLLLAIRSCIKLSLKMGWDALIAASYDIGLSRMRTATIRQTYNSDEPLSILSYDDSQVVMEGRMFNGSFLCANVVSYLEKVPGYLPKAKRSAAKEAILRIIFELYVNFTYALLIKKSSYDFNSADYKPDVSKTFGWFSMCSKLKHSCEPNLMVVGLNDSVALVTLKTIKKGEELTISYIGHLYESEPCKTDDFYHAATVFMCTKHICNCQNCQKKRNNSTVHVNMTAEKKTLFLDLAVNLDKETNWLILYKKVCKALDIFPINSIPYKVSCKVLAGLYNILECKETNNKTYL